MTELLIFVGGLLVLMAIGLPVVVAIGVTSFIALVATGTGGLPVELLPLRMVQTLNNFTLLAIPLFILAANIMNIGSTTTRIFDFYALKSVSDIQESCRHRLLEAKGLIDHPWRKPTGCAPGLWIRATQGNRDHLIHHGTPLVCPQK